MKQRTGKVRERMTSENRGMSRERGGCGLGRYATQRSKEVSKVQFFSRLLNTPRFGTNECGCTGRKGSGEEEKTRTKSRYRGRRVCSAYR